MLYQFVFLKKCLTHIQLVFKKSLSSFKTQLVKISSPGLALLLLLLWGIVGCKTYTPHFYPIGIYSVRSTNNFPELKSAGFNIVVGPANKEYLDAAHTIGLKILASPNTTAGPEFDTNKAYRCVRAFDKHPALWAWYLCDEPDLNLISPDYIKFAHKTLKKIRAKKPTAIVLYKGSEALAFGRITDILMIDRYPIPWLPLSNFPLNIRMGRLAAGQSQRLIAVIQAFDWSYYPEFLVDNLQYRPPNYDELRCMVFSALVCGADGIFFYAFDDGRWRMTDHPDTWSAVKNIVNEINKLSPIFSGAIAWWPVKWKCQPSEFRFNESQDPAVQLALIYANTQNLYTPAGWYIVAVNTTAHELTFGFNIPWQIPTVSVLNEERSIETPRFWLEDKFLPYQVHVYGPMKP